MPFSHSISLGKEGEQVAAQYLESKGYSILYRNYRVGRHEIDIIALCGLTLHFVEVKTRAQSKHGLPEKSVTTQKIGRMLGVADHFQENCSKDVQWEHIQFDIIAIQKINSSWDIKWIEDVYV